MIIRSFRNGDERLLQRVFLSAVWDIASKDYSTRQIQAWASRGLDSEKWINQMRKIKPFIADKNGIIVGYANIRPTGYIDHFFVSKMAARTGVGTALMEKIHSLAQEQSILMLQADVSITARPFFHKWGFNSVARQIAAIEGMPLENFRMIKRLSHPIK